MASVQRLLGKASTHPCSGVRHARFAMAKGGVWDPSGETLAARPDQQRDRSGRGPHSAGEMCIRVPVSDGSLPGAGR